MANKFLAVDVGYHEKGALAAAVIFSTWEQTESDLAYTSLIPEVAPYRPGQFYLRELPCILKILKKLDSFSGLNLVDGYVWLNQYYKPGLGARLHDALQEECAVVGVSKSCFFKGRNVAEVTRGRSRQPLFVTSVGVDIEEAACGVRNMHGEYRIPTLLSEADRLSKGILKI